MTAGPRPAPSGGPPALCLDLSRLVSRAGLGPWTGVDRVEAAWLRWLLAMPVERPVFGLVRMRGGYALFGRAGLSALEDRLSARVPWGPAGPLARRLPGGDALPARIAGDLARFSLTKCGRFGINRLLVSDFETEIRYLNVGHSNLGARVLKAWAQMPGARIVVLVHDLIPLEHPQFQRPGMPARFEARMRRVAATADLVVCPSRATEAAVRARFAGWGRCPDTVVAPLGAAPARPEPEAVPPGLCADGPYVVCLGTIEPRKNHALLLDIWARRGGAPGWPRLLILGRRGWENAAVFARLDAGVPGVVERGGLGDGAVAALVEGAAALLFPSHAEGYGLPALEAAALGCPVVCADLPVFRETLGDAAVYAPPDAPYEWEKHIRRLAEAWAAGESRIRRPAPDWTAHFNRVLTHLW